MKQLIFIFAMASCQLAIPQEDSKAPAVDPVTEEIGKNALAFAEAFNAADAKSIAAMFTDDGEMSVDGHTIARGGKDLESVYEGFFKENPGAVISIHIESVRKLGPATVIEKGVSEIVNDDDDSVVDSYTAIHTKQGDKWLTVSTDVRQQEVDADFDWKEELGNLVGTWEAGADDWNVTTTFEWAAGGNFLKREFKRFEGEDLQSSGVTVIGWDPVNRTIRSWVFGSNGSHGGGFWMKDGNQWVVETEAVTPEGDLVTATNIFTILSKDEFRWQSVNRSISGVALDDTDSIRIKRISNDENPSRNP